MTQTTISETASEVTASGSVLLGRRVLDALLHWLKHPMLAVLAVMLVITSIASPGFWSLVNLQNLVMQNAPLTVVAVGMTLVIIAGGFDLSVGSIFAAGAVFYISMDGVLPAWLALLLALLIGLAIGLINGFVVNVLHVNPFVATLGSSSVIIGLVSMYYSASQGLFARSESFRYLGKAKIGIIPVSFLVASLVVVAIGLLLARSTYGRSVYAVGGNVQAARLNGIRVGMISASTFALLGVLSALGGVILASQVGTGEPSFGAELTLDAIAVVVIGGTSLLGGEGAIWGTVVGVAILAILTNVFATLSLDPNLQSVIKGVLVIVAVAVDVWFYRRRSR